MLQFGGTFAPTGATPVWYRVQDMPARAPQLRGGVGAGLPSSALPPSWQKPGPAHRIRMPPLSLLRALYKHRLAAALTVLLGAVATGGLVYQLPAIYRTEAVILVESQRIPEKFVASTVDVDLRDRVNNISQRILSYRRLLEIIEKFNLYRLQRAGLSQEELVQEMRKDITIRVEGGGRPDHPGAFRIAYQGPDPNVVALVTNQLANLFIEENLRAREVHALGTSEFLESQLAESRKRLEEQEAKLSEYKLRHNGELPQQENVLLATASRHQLQLQAVQEAISRAQQQKLLLESTLAAAEASVAALGRFVEALEEQGKPDGSLGSSARLSESLEKQLAAAKVKYTADHPEVRGLEQMLQLALRMEQEERTARREGVGTSDGISAPAMKSRQGRFTEMLIRERERVENLKAQITVAAKQIEILEKERHEANRQLQAVLARLHRLPIREQELASLTRDYEITRANYQSLLDKRLAAEMATEMETRQKGERFTLLEAARVPEQPVRPNRSLLLAIGMAASLLLGFALAVGIELSADTILGEWELPPHVAILGRVPAPAGHRNRSRHLRPRQLAVVASALLLLALLGAIALYLGWVSPQSAPVWWKQVLDAAARWL